MLWEPGARGCRTRRKQPAARAEASSRGPGRWLGRLWQAKDLADVGWYARDIDLWHVNGASQVHPAQISEQLIDSSALGF